MDRMWDRIELWAAPVQGDPILLPRLEETDTAVRFGTAGIQAELTIDFVGDGVWSLSCHAQTDDAFCGDAALRMRWKADPVDGYFANHLVGSYWCRPYFGQDPSDCPPDTQVLLCRRGDVYEYRMAVCNATHKSALQGDPEGWALTVSCGMDGLPRLDGCILLGASGTDPFALAQMCTDRGLELLENGCLPKRKRSYPECLEYLGWCSWDAFQIRVSQSGVEEKCRELRDKGVPVRWVLLDDMWGDAPELNDIPPELPFRDMLRRMQQCSLRSFEADSARFPDGLRGCIRRLRDDYGVKVGVWHPTTGYWHGLLPGGQVDMQLGSAVINAANGQRVHGYTYSQARAFYEAFQSFLKDCGASFVKVDNQGFLARYYAGLAPIGAVARTVHRAIDDVAQELFGGALINCMGMPTESFWNRPHSAVARCSGDFMPDDREWFIRHTLQCAYNSFALGTLMVCDWDMWWTDDGQAALNGLLHAISGGPVYVSDPLGHTNAEVLRPLAFNDGRLLRCDRPAMPVAACLTEDCRSSGKPLQLWTIAADCGVLCALNLDETGRPVEGMFIPDQVFPHLAATVLVYEYFSETAQVVDARQPISVVLENSEMCRLYLVISLGQWITPIGRTDKYVSCLAVTHREERAFTLYEGGVCRFYASAPVRSVTVNGDTVPYTEKDGVYTLDCSGEEHPYISVEFKEDKE